jgi:plasmid stability protein
MSSMVQIRNVPEDMHRKLKSRAALSGMSLSEYILSELQRSLERPTKQELLERLATRSSVKLKPRPAALVAAERERR